MEVDVTAGEQTDLGGLVRLYKGIPFPYRAAGPATGIPVVFLHHHDLFVAQALEFLRG
jgi:hypothetical protein